MATQIRIKRSAQAGKRPTLENLALGELALNTYEGYLFAERDTGGVGIGTTISLLTPWTENYGAASIYYGNSVGIGTTNPFTSADTNNTSILNVGIVTSNYLYGEGGDITLGDIAGGYRAGAYTVETTDTIDNSIDELNYILGKLVPNQPDNIDGVDLTLTGTQGTAFLCNFTPTNNTDDSIPSPGSELTRNIDSTITTTYITDYGPGDTGTLTGYVNTVGVGTTTFNVSFGLYAVGNNAGTSDAIQIDNNTDAADSVRNVGITSLFYEVYDARFINAASPDGYNEAYFIQGSNTTNSVYWYEDPSTVGAPVISFSNMSTPSSSVHTVAHSSGVPHYTESTNNNFTYVATVENATGDMYTFSNFKLLKSDGQTTGFSNPGNKLYNNFAGGTNPPAKNYGVGTGVTTLITQTPRNIHNTITSNHFTTFDAVTPYGSHNNQRIDFSTNVNIMGTSAITNKIDEDNVSISGTLGSGFGNATRVDSGSTGDNPTPVYTAWTGGNTGSVATYESVVRGGILRHDQTNYSTGYLPVGPDYSSGRSGEQYFQVELIRSAVPGFKITVAGSYGACKVCMPDNSTWTTGLSNTNGWADMFVAAPGSGIPRNGNNGCASGGVMSGSSGTFTCTFGGESSTNDSNNRILIRWRLDSGDSITAMSFSAT